MLLLITQKVTMVNMVDQTYKLGGKPQPVPVLTLPQNQTLIVKAVVGGVRTNVLLDTGAGVNLIGQGWLEQAKTKKLELKFNRDGTK